VLSVEEMAGIDLLKETKKEEYAPALLERFKSLETPEIRARSEKSPVHLPGKTGKIAMDLFETATGAGVLDQVQKELLELQGWFQNEVFDNFIQDNLMISKKEQHELFTRVLKDFSLVVQRTVALDLIEECGLHMLPKVILAFNEIAATYKKEIEIELTFHAAPTDIKLLRVKGEVLLRLPPDVKPIWVVKTKPALLSGYTVSAGEYYETDNSLLAENTAYDDKLALLVATLKQSYLSSVAGLEMEVEAPVPEPVKSRAEQTKLTEDAKKYTIEQEQATWRRQFVDWV